MPLYYLGNQKGWETGWMYFDDFINRGKIGWMQVINDSDLFIFPRLNAPNDEVFNAIQGLFRVIRLAGKRVVYEVDDDFTNKYRKVAEGKTVEISAMADAVTVTQQYLARVMKKASNRPTHILPNCIDPSVWRDTPVKRMAHGKKVVALTGSSTHYRDWEVMKDVIPFIAKRDDTVVILMGYWPNYLQGIEGVEYIEALPYEMYAQVIRQSDIVLAPVDPFDKFNLGKSSIKAVEAMAAGAVPVATGNEIYSQAIKDKKTGVLIHNHWDPQEWLTAINDLLDNEVKMFTVRQEAHKWAYKRHDISTEWRQWASAYQKILAAPPNAF